ncbi:MAG: hypothetical protein JWM49_2651 [Microbacteriaceae bacterium]|jgi:hypothetical protein|nr:hypothetical protein [Microbacteriaceae bacterium]
MTTQRSSRVGREEDCTNGSAGDWEKYRHAVAAFYVAKGHFPRRSSRFPSERRLANWLEAQPSTHGLVSPADRLRGALPGTTAQGHPKQPRSGTEDNETRQARRHFWVHRGE